MTSSPITISRPRLVYFDFAGRAQAIRDALAIGGVAFEDVRVTYAEFVARRASGELPYGSLPALQLPDGSWLGQSNTILRWAGHQAGLTPRDPLQALRVDAILDCVEDFGGRVSTSIRVQDEGVRAALRAQLAKQWLPEFYGLLTRHLLDNAGWLAAGALTVADLKVVHLIDKLTNGSLSGLPTDALTDFPEVDAWRQRVHAERQRRLGL